MKLWRYSKKRSARRQARRDLRASYQGSSWALGVQRIVRVAQRLGWWLPLVMSTVLTLPLAAYVGSMPGWLDSAWPVTAVLIGFVIPLILFLLQGVGDGGLRASRTFRVIIGRSAVAWPTMFSLWFIVAIGVIERFGGKTSAPSWVATWSLGLFILQWVMLVVTFGRLTELLAPAGLTKALGRSLAADIGRGVLERLVRENAAARMDAAWRLAGWPGPSGFSGSDVTLYERGYADDLDIELPKHLEALDQVTHLRTWFNPLGENIEPGWKLAVLTNPPSNPAVAELYRNAVFVRRRPRANDSWKDLFRDVLDLVLRAIESGRDGDSELAIAVVVSGLMTVPDTFRRHGQDYTEAGALQWRRNYEEVMFEALVGLGSSAAFSARTDALYRLVAMPFQIAVASIEHDANPMFELSLRLWLAQAHDARAIGVRQSTNAVNERIHRLSGSLADQLMRSYQDPQLSLNQRIEAARRFTRVDWLQSSLLRRHLDAEDLVAFRALLDEMPPWNRLFDPQQTVRTITQQLAATDVEAKKAALASELSIATRIAGESDALLELGSWQLFKVGAWATWQYRRNEIAETTWRAMTNRLADPFLTGTIAQRLGTIGGTGAGDNQVLRELDEWDRERVEIRPSFDSWSPQHGIIALWWATLLLIRDWSLTSDQQLPIGSFHTYGAEVRANLDTVTREREKWAWFVGPDLDAKVAAIQQALTDAQDAAYARARTSAEQDDEAEAG